MSFKVTVYGGTNNKSYSQDEINECEKLGTWLGKNRIEILTGACKGMPYFTGRASVLAGGKVTGFTPAKTRKEHVDKYDFPLDGVSNLVFNKTRYYTMAENFLRRSWDMTPFSDIVVALGGSWGTYSELIFSFFAKKIIILVEGLGGAVEAFINGSIRFTEIADVVGYSLRNVTAFKMKDIDDVFCVDKNTRSAAAEYINRIRNTNT